MAHRLCNHRLQPRLETSTPRQRGPHPSRTGHVAAQVLKQLHARTPQRVKLPAWLALYQSIPDAVEAVHPLSRWQNELDAVHTTRPPHLPDFINGPDPLDPRLTLFRFDWRAT